MAPTTLYEKLFIDGFHKPSYVVATVTLAALPDPERLDAACLALLERHPRLRSLARMRLGVPVALAPQPPPAWFERGGPRRLRSADLRALEARLLATPLDLARDLPAELYVVEDPPALVLKVHHAVLDAASGYALLHDFAAALLGAPLPSEARAARRGEPRGGGLGAPLRRAADWLAHAQLRPRVPALSVTTSYHPTTVLEHEPVATADRLVPGGFTRIVRRARELSATASELFASALLSAMHARNVARAAGGPPPPEVGLMFARARLRAATGDASFRADTCLVSVPSAQLAAPHHAATLAELRRAANDPHHNDLALALLYAARKLRGRERLPTAQRSLQLTLSDLTAFGRLPPGLAATLPVADLRVLASPTSFDHAGVIVSRLGPDLRLAAIAHAGALDLEALLTETLHLLGEP